MRYLLIDQITEWKSTSTIKGIKNVAMSEDFLEFHFPNHPIMPGVLLLEALVQLAGWLEAKCSGFNDWVLIDKVKKCRFYDFALPGDQVDLEVQSLCGAAPKRKTYRGIGKVNGKKKIVSEFEGKVVQLSKLEDIADQKRFFRILTREFLLSKDE